MKETPTTKEVRLENGYVRTVDVTAVDPNKVDGLSSLHRKMFGNKVLNPLLGHLILYEFALVTFSIFVFRFMVDDVSRGAWSFSLPNYVYRDGWEIVLLRLCLGCAHLAIVGFSYTAIQQIRSGRNTYGVIGSALLVVLSICEALIFLVHPNFMYTHVLFLLPLIPFAELFSSL